MIYSHLSGGQAISFGRNFSRIEETARDVWEILPASLINDFLQAVVYTRACMIFPLYRRHRSTIIIQPPVSDRRRRNPERPLSKIRKAAAAVKIVVRD